MLAGQGNITPRMLDSDYPSFGVFFMKIERPRRDRRPRLSVEGFECFIIRGVFIYNLLKLW